MRSDRRRRALLAATAAGCIGLALAAAPAAVTAAAAAEGFPVRPIQLVIPFAPGDTDNMLRPFVERMGEFLGQPIVLAYKPGAGGGIGAGSVAASRPDGYTLVGTSPGSVVVVPLANKDVRYTPESFAPVVSLAEGGLMLVVPAASPWKTVGELIEHSKKNPGRVTFTSSGALGITHLLAEVLAREAGVQWSHIPYQGSAPAITALLGGHVEMASTAIAPAQAHIKAGSLRALAVFGDSRLKAYPEVPTLRELGYDVGSPTLYGLLAPAGTPRGVIDALHAAAKKTVDRYGEQIATGLAVFGAEVRLLGPDEYAAYLQRQNRLFSTAVRSLK